MIRFASALGWAVLACAAVAIFLAVFVGAMNFLDRQFGNVGPLCGLGALVFAIIFYVAYTLEGERQ